MDKDRIPDIDVDRWNSIVYAVCLDKTVENCGLDLTEEEAELFNSFKEQKEEMKKRFPGMPVTLAPLEKETDSF